MRAMLPSEVLFDLSPPRTCQLPERRLMLAVLRTALVELEKLRATRSPRIDRLVELKDWFLSDDRSWPFSFENACEELNLNPGWIRARLFPEKTSGHCVRVANL